MFRADTTLPGPGRHALRQSILLHTGVLGLIILLPYLHRPPEVLPPRMVEAVLVRPGVPAPEPTPPPPAPPRVVEPPRPAPEKHDVPPPREIPKIPLPAPKPVEKKPLPEKPPEKPVAKPEPARPVPPKPIIRKPTLDTRELDAEMQAMQKDVQQAELDRLKREAEKSAAAVHATANQAIVGKYMGLIRQRTETKWNRPLSARRGMVTTLRITVLPGGEVANVVTVKSSGDPAFDASAEDAVRKANPLPVPDDASAFNQYFRVITLKFNPEDL